MNWTKEIIKITGRENCLVSNGDGSAYDWIELKIKNADQLSKVLKFANDNSLKVITKPRSEVESTVCNWIEKQKKQAPNFVYLDMTPMNEIIEHVESDQIISVQTGLKIDSLNEHLSKTNQWLPAYGKSAHSTILNLIETGSGGSLDTTYGGGRNLVLGLETTLADGTRIRSGGKIVKNVTGYDMTKLLVGSDSWFGISDTTHLRLFAKPDQINTFVIPLETETEIEKIYSKIFDSGAPLASLDVVDRKITDLMVEQTNHRQYQRLWQKIKEQANSTNSICEAIISFAGNLKEVEECDPLVKSLTKSQYLKLEKDVQDELIKSLSQLESLLDRQSIELNSTIKESYRIFKTIAELDSNLNWVFSPATGRLAIMFDTQKTENIELMIKKLANSLNTHQIISAPSNSSLKRIFNTESENAKTLKRIKYDLKEKFDQNHILNPLVEF